jgi:hypothetical protein
MGRSRARGVKMLPRLRKARRPAAARSLALVALLTNACSMGTAEREPVRRTTDGVDDPSAPSSADPSGALGTPPMGPASGFTEPPVATPTHVLAPLPEPSQAVSVCGEEAVACCSDPNICDDEGCTLIGWEPCAAGLTCCASECRLSCQHPEQPLDAWSTEPECELEPFKACLSDAECALVEYRRNCCGTRVATGVHVDAVAEVQALIARCESAETCGDCMAEETIDDNGTRFRMHSVVCSAGRCRSTSPLAR